MNSMNAIRQSVFFFAGAMVGAAIISSAMAYGLVPYWNKTQVKPVVVVTYDYVAGFRLPDDRLGNGPRWTKEEVTAIAETTYHNVYGFVPVKTNQNIQIGPRWNTDEVIPWMQVVLASTGDFVPKP